MQPTTHNEFDAMHHRLLLSQRNRTKYEYDANNNLVRVEKPAPEGQTKVIDYIYDEQNRIIGQTDPLGNVTTYEYDELGHLITMIDPGLHKTTYTYDPQGNLLTQTDASNVKITYEYDKLNRKIHTYDNLDHHEYCEYDLLGRKIKVTDPTGVITRYAYDPLGRLISITDAQGKITSYQYNAKGYLKLVINAARKTIMTNSYDEIDRLISQVDGDGHATEFQYDAVGNLVWQKDANQQLMTKQYDKENRLQSIVYPDSTQVQYSYDGNGNLIQMIDSTGISIYEYDSLDRLMASLDSFGMRVGYGYDLEGNQTSVAYPADTVNPARTVWYTYDPMNRLDTITDWSGRRLEYGYDVSGRMNRLDYPNGVQQRRSYDTAGRLSSLVYVNSNNQTLISYGYTRDAMGNPVDVQETGTLQPHFSVPLIEKYTYDKDNRLVSTDRPAAYVYDNNGNCTQRTLKGTPMDFRYDFHNRLISQKTGDSQVRHIYDGLGNRIVRQDNTTEVRYVLDCSKGMSHVLCEMNASGQIVAYYIHGLELVGRITVDNSPRYYHTDQIGNVVALTDETAAITDRYAYSPFGLPGGSEGSTPNPFTYVGGLGVMKEADGLYFMRARFYNADSGRFMNKDPLGDIRTTSWSSNLYLYASNDPIRYNDPQGLSDESTFNQVSKIVEVLNYGKMFSWISDAYEIPRHTGAYDIAYNNYGYADELASTRELTMAGKVNGALQVIGLLNAIRAASEGDVVGASMPLLTRLNPAIGPLFLANELPVLFGGPHTVSEALLGPEAGSLKFDIGYGPRQYFWNAAVGALWLYQNPQDAMGGLDQFWWGELAKPFYFQAKYGVDYLPEYFNYLAKGDNYKWR